MRGSRNARPALTNSMINLHSRNRFALPLLAAFVLTALDAPAQTSVPSPRVVNCDAHVQSHKRGVCANKLQASDFAALAPGPAVGVIAMFRLLHSPDAAKIAHGRG